MLKVTYGTRPLMHTKTNPTWRKHKHGDKNTHTQLTQSRPTYADTLQTHNWTLTGYVNYCNVPGLFLVVWSLTVNKNKFSALRKRIQITMKVQSFALQVCNEFTLTLKYEALHRLPCAAHVWISRRVWIDFNTGQLSSIVPPLLTSAQ
jgi:hypothetical protein